MLPSISAAILSIVTWLFMDGTAEKIPRSGVLPSAAYCTAAFDVTFEQLSAKSGDPEMTRAFREDAKILRTITIAEAQSEAIADAAIAAARRDIGKKRHSTGETPDLAPCYRVKALGPRRG